jgi:NAD(P)-dependent dehydrogenase (short-subunit alcohol dehydrogenase family)
MVLNDGTFADKQSAAHFRKQAEAKYWGTVHLDAAIRKLCSNSKDIWFVVFSSVSAGHGNEGQSGYATANAAMEGVVVRRHADGLIRSVAIQWGVIGDVGVIFEAGLTTNNDTLFAGTVAQRIHSCVTVLDRMLFWGHAVVAW